jgi:DNA polymerase-3 subunit delta
MSVLAWLVDGEDPTLVADEVRRLVSKLAGGDPALTVEDFWGDEVDLEAVAGACATPPFLADRRVVVLRDAGRFSADDVRPLLAYLEDPLPTTSLIVAAGGGGRIATKLANAIKKVGEVVSVGPGRDARGWVEARLREAPLRFEAAARTQLTSHLGEDLGRLPALIEALVASYGSGASIGVAELEPFLGEAGSVAPWELTDAIDRGDTETALTVLHRLLHAGDRHPLVVLAVLHRHVAQALQLDGSGATSEAAAAAILGIAKGRSTFPARKALATSRRWGSDGVARAIRLLADADVDLRGESTWPAEAVLEVLVARLSRLAPRRAGASSSRR